MSGSGHLYVEDMNGLEVVGLAISVLAEVNSRSRNVQLNKVRQSQISELSSSLANPKINMDLVEWEFRNRYKRQLAVAILDDLKPGWNRKQIPIPGYPSP